MEYVEFTFNQKINQLTCKWYLKNKPRLIHLNDAKTLFRELTRTQAPYKIREIGDKQIIRYYNVNRVLYYQIERNRKNAQSKVSRQNKFKRQVLALTSSLAAAITIFTLSNKILASDKDVKVNNLKKTYSISNQDESLLADNYFSNAIYYYEPFAEQPLSQENDTVTDTFDFTYEDRSLSDRAETTRQYTEVITKYAKMYGIDPNLMIAIATQENTIHSEEINNSGALGLFQIQVEGSWNWVGKDLTAYNHETNNYETINVSLENLYNLDYNVKVGCMIMANYLQYCDYNIPVAVQAYNSGTKTKDLYDKYQDNWLYYREELPGDTEYLEHVFSFIKKDNSLITVTTPENNDKTIKINNNQLDIKLDR